MILLYSLAHQWLIFKCNFAKLLAQEWIPSTPKHVILYHMLGFKAPEFAHLPLLLKPNRAKLSKRNNDAFVDYYKVSGWCHEKSISA